MFIAAASIALFAQEEELATKEALGKLDQMSEEVNNFVGRVRFDESDVKSLVDLWDEYNAFGEYEYETDDEVDIESMLDDDRYLRRAESNNVDAEDWARKTARITMMRYREQMLEAAKATTSITKTTNLTRTMTPTTTADKKSDTGRPACSLL